MPTNPLRALFLPESPARGESHSRLLVLESSPGGSHAGLTILRTLHVYCWDGCWQIVEDMLGHQGFRVCGIWTAIEPYTIFSSPFLRGRVSPSEFVWENPLEVMPVSKKGVLS